MYLKKFGKVFTSKFVGTGPSSYEKSIYRGVVSQRLRNTDLDKGKYPKESSAVKLHLNASTENKKKYSNLIKYHFLNRPTSTRHRTTCRTYTSIMTLNC